MSGDYLAGLHVSRTYGDSYWNLTMVEVIGFGGMLLGGVVQSCLKVDANGMGTVALRICCIRLRVNVYECVSFL